VFSEENWLLLIAKSKQLSDTAVQLIDLLKNSTGRSTTASQTPIDSR